MSLSPFHIIKKNKIILKYYKEAWIWMAFFTQRTWKGYDHISELGVGTHSTIFINQNSFLLDLQHNSIALHKVNKF